MLLRHDRSIRQPRGFTLVELLVVITIIGMLMALLLPAVNAAVEAARNVQCKNNVGQLAKAANVYQSEKNRYPGWENNLGGKKVSWVVEMLPQLDRLDLHTDYAAGIVPAKLPYIEMLICPSDPPEQIGSKSILSYVANSGKATQLYATTADQETAVKNGIFHNSAVRTNVDHLKDGGSYTLLFTENIQSRKSSGANNGWATLGGGSGVREMTTFVWHATVPADGKINQNKTASGVSINLARPSSFHSGGVNVAFADTHVIFLKEEIPYEVYRQLMTPHHRESDAPDKATHILDEAAYK